MGIGAIIENNLANGFQYIWKKSPQLPSLSLNLQKFNKPFVSFVALVGLYTLYKSSIVITQKSLQLIGQKNTKVPSSLQMQDKYGQNSYTLIVDCKGNEQYCILLAKKGFNIILCGEDEDVQIAADRLMRQTGEHKFRVQTVLVDWNQDAKNLQIYQDLLQQLKDFDISIMVMPVIRQQAKTPTHLEKVPVFQHVYLMARFFGPKLKWRSYSSAIIIPSLQDVDKIDDKQNGITKAVQSGIDAFGRTLGFELKGAIQVVVGRGLAENAIANLGKNRISH